jgi:hypothetical protein
MKRVEVNNGRDDAQFKTDVVEAKYKAHFVGQFCLKTAGGGWANAPADVYWQEKPPVEGYSHYFALIYQHGSPYITSGASAVEQVISAVESDGEIIYSRYRHDFRQTKDGKAIIDGGRDYVKRAGGGRDLQLKVIDGYFYELELADMDEFNVKEAVEDDKS